ncbi:hypothetical protein R3P38DRAFT_3197614 [Favolaschia claudopus]|uniref:Uncharacterized protein n=1 Tax=Favolaschia claudopus TaxID=2862362 RepID=A0AAW0B2F0_9AGAR
MDHALPEAFPFRRAPNVMSRQDFHQHALNRFQSQGLVDTGLRFGDTGLASEKKPLTLEAFKQAVILKHVGQSDHPNSLQPPNLPSSDMHDPLSISLRHLAQGLGAAGLLHRIQDGVDPPVADDYVIVDLDGGDVRDALPRTSAGSLLSIEDSPVVKPSALHNAQARISPVDNPSDSKSITPAKSTMGIAIKQGLSPSLPLANTAVRSSKPLNIQNPKIAKTGSQNRCSVCRELGHNARRHKSSPMASSPQEGEEEEEYSQEWLSSGPGSPSTGDLQ